VKLSRNEALVAAALALLGLAVAGAGFLLAIQPQRHKVSSIGTEITAANEQLAALHSGAGKPPAVRAADLFRLARAMPGIDDQAGVVLELSQLAQTTEMKVVSVRFQPRVALATGSSALPIILTLDGNWKGLSRFLKTMRRRVELDSKQLSVAGRVYDVDNVQISNAAKPAEIEAVLTMNAFDYGAPPSPSATAGVGNTSTSTTTTTTTSSGAAQAAGGTGSGS
jgi:hypothetical protein